MPSNQLVHSGWLAWTLTASHPVLPSSAGELSSCTFLIWVGGDAKHSQFALMLVMCAVAFLALPVLSHCSGINQMLMLDLSFSRQVFAEWAKLGCANSNGCVGLFAAHADC